MRNALEPCSSIAVGEPPSASSASYAATCCFVSIADRGRYNLAARGAVLPVVPLCSTLLEGWLDEPNRYADRGRVAAAARRAGCRLQPSVSGCPQRVPLPPPLPVPTCPRELPLSLPSMPRGFSRPLGAWAASAHWTKPACRGWGVNNSVPRSKLNIFLFY